MTEAPAGEAKTTVPFHQLTIPDEWKDEPRIKLGAGKREYAIAPMSGRNIVQFTKLAIGLKTGIDLIKGNVEMNFEELYRLVWLGLLRAYPELTFDAFYDSDTLPNQLQESFEVISKAAGMEARVVTKGEAQAAQSPENSSTGTGTIS